MTIYPQAKHALEYRLFIPDTISMYIFYIYLTNLSIWFLETFP